MIEGVLADREILYFVHEDGCAACAAARPELEKFISKHPAAMVLSIEARGPFPERLGVKIRATPTYLFRKGDGLVKLEGALRCTDIEKLIKKAGGHL